MNSLSLLAVVVAAGVGVWYFTKSKPKGQTTSEQVADATGGIAGLVKGVGGLLDDFWDDIPTDGGAGNPGGATNRTSQGAATRPLDFTSGPTAYVPLSQRVFSARMA